MEQTPSPKNPQGPTPHAASRRQNNRNSQNHRASREHQQNRGRNSQNPGSQNRQHNRGRPQQPRPLSPERLEQRRAAVPHISYPEQLPVSARREEIAAAIRDNQVVIVAGETGSGQTTQLPKICLELGRGISGFIGHTQPRRIAARSVAERICDELKVKLGGAIGYQVRFTEEVGPNTLVKLMTDGILLAEIQSDPNLLRYDTLIIDEAHERSLNIDFILGYLAQLLPRRPELKIIITSATIDTERFAAHFGGHRAGGTPGSTAPIIEVSGRTYPVEIRYRPLFDDDFGDDDADRAHESSLTMPRSRKPQSSRGSDDADRAHGSLGTSSSKNKPATPGRAEAIDQITGVVAACEELMAEGPGDILVFLSGEGEIRDTQQAFQDELKSRYIEPGGRSSVPGAVEVLPLYARLSAAEQHRIFERHQQRRIILSTNIAETSLTVPGIRYVVDPGTARISRYSNRTKVQRLPIEPVSQASANQRSGRCGRVADGICIRLYSEEDFAHRDEFTQPEIQRTSLASVILQMISLGLGDVSKFPFIDPPDERAVRAGTQLLEEIGAIDTRTPHHASRHTAARPEEAAQTTHHYGPRLTRIGHQLARLPIDPRLGRMLIEAQKNGCASEVLVLVAALSVQDVRERPTEKRAQADQLHARFTASSSDFLAYLTLWRYLHTQQRELSGSQFRRMCRGEFLNYLRYREWTDVVGQLQQMARSLDLTIHPLALPSPRQIREADITGPAALGATSDSGAVAATCRELGRSADTPEAGAIHRSMLVGLLSNLGNWSERSRDYLGARGTHFVIWPGSGLHRRTPAWVMSAELVETSRLFARTVATIEPHWIEPLAKHLTKRSFSEPIWSSRSGAAMCREKVTLYGMTLVADRQILLSSVGTDSARELAREMFIRHGLVEGDWRTHHKFLKENTEALEEAAETEQKLRRHGLIADEDALAVFYEERIPDNIVSGRHFDSWWKKERHERPDLLNFTQEFLLGETSASGADFPTEWVQGDLTLPLEYAFNPGKYGDGVTVTIPVTLLPQVDDAGFDWLVPGLREELITGTIRALPKRIRRQLVPAPDVARAILPLLEEAQDLAERSNPSSQTFRQAFTDAVFKLRGFWIEDADWAEVELPPHLHMNFRVRSERGAILEESTSLAYVQRSLAPRAKSAVENVVKGAVALALDEARRGLLGNGGTGPRGSGAKLGADNGDKARAAIRAAEAEARAQMASAEPLTDWPNVPDGVIPSSIETTGPHGMVVRGYPALVVTSGPSSAAGKAGAPSTSASPAQHTRAGAPGAQASGAGGQVKFSVLAEPTDQVREHRQGVIQLLAQNVALPEARITSRWSGQQSLALAGTPYPSTSVLVTDLQLTAVRNLADTWCAQNRVTLGELRAKSDWEAMRIWVRDRHEDEVYRLAQLAASICTEWAGVQQAIKANSSIVLLGTVTDVRDQLADLMPVGFLYVTPADRLPHLVRYLKAAGLRIDKAQLNPTADNSLAWQVQDVSEKIAAARRKAAGQPYDPATAGVLRDARWMLEELRVSLFAQQLGTQGKVSAKRIEKLLAGV